jgi:hypothetical protein
MSKGKAAPPESGKGGLSLLSQIAGKDYFLVALLLSGPF